MLFKLNRKQGKKLGHYMNIERLVDSWPFILLIR
jgi:hypothetical protein